MQDKLEMDLVRDWSKTHDIIVLSETKTTASPSLPGFVAINNSKHRHGGVAVLIKRYLFPQVSHIDIDDEGVIWFELSSLPGIIFCGMYNEPSDSTYFRHETFASIPAHIEDGKQAVIVCDLNARLGSNVHSIMEGNDSLCHSIVDTGKNKNGETITELCIKNLLVPVNNLSTLSSKWSSDLTYRKKTRWISEVDLCLISIPLVDAVSNFHVNKDVRFPSDHAPVSVALDFNRCLDTCKINELVERSHMIGSYSHLTQDKNNSEKKPIPYRSIDGEAFTRNIEELPVPNVVGANVGELLENVTDTLYTCAQNSKKKTVDHYANTKPSNRWHRIKAVKDSSALWKGIDWNGQYRETVTKEGPSEGAFQNHMERLLNPDGADPVIPDDVQSDVTIPLLDDPFSPIEMLDVAYKQMKPSGCGLDGFSSGVMKLLPASWLALLLVILNAIFISGLYPVSWSVSKLIMLYKKGPLMNCWNYRGISIMHCISKCYDYLIHNRLTKWYKVCREQAGAQLLRGCVEHIITLRLIIELFKKKRKPLFVAFIDFSKAYDRVPRMYLLKLLRKLGCGKMMLAALAAMYRITQFLLGSVLITAMLGVKQGSPYSCFLFTLFVDEFVRLLKQKSVHDGLLDWLHLLVLMDDTVIFATSHEKLKEKLNVLTDWCNQSGMVINEDKTKFMSFNCSERSPIQLETHAGPVTVSYCQQYTYLGSIFTSDGKIASSVKKHALSRVNAFNKLVRFLDKNRNAPFDVKKLVVDACFSSSLLYGCEAWLEEKVPVEVERMYMKSIKCLLGVRPQTASEVVLMESGYPSLKATIRSRQQKFFVSKIRERSDMTDDPLMHAIRTTQAKNPSMKNFIDSLVNGEDFIAADKTNRMNRLRSPPANRSKLITYSTINPSYVVHPIYHAANEQVDEYLRITFTRFRTSSHRLRVETGRWCRIPREKRLCQCGEGVQTEEHIIMHCPRTEAIKLKYGQDIESFQTFISEKKSQSQLLMLYEMLKLLEI